MTATMDTLTVLSICPNVERFGFFGFREKLAGVNLMPRYFFHTTNRADHEGVVFDDDHIAQREAVVTVGEIIKDLGAQFADGGRFEMYVMKDDGTKVCELDVTARCT